jgi:phosphoenolpyruvate carboxylase
MFGFSDSAKESGIFMQKMIDNTIKEVKAFCDEIGVKVHIFYGTGLDIGRGGGLVKKEQTIQGNHKRFCFESGLVGVHYLLVALTSQQHEQGKLIVEDVDPAIEKYRNLIFSQRQQLDRYLSASSPFYAFVKACNYSSRPTKRDDNNKENKGILDGLRAISQVNAIEGTFLNFNLWYGADLVPVTADNMLTLTKAAFGIMHADVDAAKLYIQDEENLKFFLELKAEYERVKKHLEGVKLPTELNSMLKQRKALFDYTKKLMVVLSNEFVRAGNFKSILGEDESYIQEVIGTIYAAFTEYRTAPLLFINFLFDLITEV